MKPSPSNNQDEFPAVKPEEIYDIITNLESYADEKKYSLDHILTILESYECWDPYIEIIEGYINTSNKSLEIQINLHVRYAKVLLNYLNRKSEMIHTLNNLIATTKISYYDFSRKLLFKIIGKEDFTSEAFILENIYTSFQNHFCKVSCLERVCFILEKKKFDEEKMHFSFERLIGLDPLNKKALLYFKALHSHNSDWIEVASILELLLNNNTQSISRFRNAQELATVYLYQLNKPKEAANVLENYCINSPLDTNLVRYDCYYRIKNWPKCLKILKEELAKAKSASERSAICFHIAEIELLSKNIIKAQDFFQKSFDFDKSHINAIAKLIEISLELNNFRSVLKYLNLLYKNIDDSLLKKNILESYSKVKSRLESQKKEPA